MTIRTQEFNAYYVYDKDANAAYITLHSLTPPANCTVNIDWEENGDDDMRMVGFEILFGETPCPDCGMIGLHAVDHDMTWEETP